MKFACIFSCKDHVLCYTIYDHMVNISSQGIAHVFGKIESPNMCWHTIKASFSLDNYLIEEHYDNNSEVSP